DAQGLRLEEWLRTGRASVVKHGEHRAVYRVVLPGLDFYVKHAKGAGTRNWLRGWVRASKARREYDRACAVAARGIPTAVPLALGESATNAGDSFLITHSLPDT